VPAAESLLYGITPVVIAIVAHALWGLLKTAVKGWSTAAIGAAALVLYLFAGVPESPLLFGAAFLMSRVARQAILSMLLEPCVAGFVSWSARAKAVLGSADGPDRCRVPLHACFRGLSER
jgi:chromate transport protein ChrA